ncbi:hypothetical protein KDL01_01955 [Actinospica durhamensis]|uniref:Uncharacterized protein n=1 Tax=Actinospica durhamensis TaxID=1508375 RepID=A0A941ING6_9ACTN|nr:hypothetical protein [Actinospica durhamensis]MBR7832002.1 hypothetical protein [Actinospica durhamensis]
MDLHELMGTAVDDLPDLPDQLAEVTRIHQRRTKTKRATMVAASTALVLGVGTLTIASPWAHTATGASVGTGSTQSLQQFAYDAAKLLQSDWPVPGAKVVWKPSYFPLGVGGIDKYAAFEVTEGSQSWLLRFIFYGSSATTPYPLVTTLPSDCAIVPAGCSANADGTVHAFAPGHMDLAYVFTGDSMRYIIMADYENPTATAGLQPQGLASISPKSEPRVLTNDQLRALGLSDAMQEIYTDAASVGLLGSWVRSTATPIPSELPGS